MMEEIFSRLEKSFRPDPGRAMRSYYFSVDETRKTVFLGPDGVQVAEGRTVAEADCVCKTSAPFFLKVWQDGYRPGMQDFLSGAIKSNNPSALKEFLEAFGR